MWLRNEVRERVELLNGNMKLTPTYIFDILYNSNTLLREMKNGLKK